MKNILLIVTVLMPALSFSMQRHCLRHDELVIAVAALLGSNKFVSGSGDNTIRVWSTETGAEIMRMSDKHSVLSLAVLPDEKIVSGSFGDAVTIWDKTGAKLKTMLHDHIVNSVATLPDGNIVSGSSGHVDSHRIAN